MTSRPQRQFDKLLSQINGGSAARALPELDQMLRKQPRDPAVLTLRAEALRMSGRVPEAIEAYRLAGEHSTGARNWLIAGLLLAGDRKTEEALQCLRRAHAETPNDEAVLDTLITTLFNSGRAREGLEFGRLQLAQGTNPQFLANAALLLQSCDCYEESSEAFKRILQLAPEDAALIGSALATARFTCEWDWIESLQRKINGFYAQGEFEAPREFPLTNLTWCTDEGVNLAVTRAYAERLVAKVAPLPARAPGQHEAGERIRVGYLSCDFRNHATMHLMAGLLEAHDRGRFEIFAYDHTTPETSDYRRRFLDAVEHHVEIHSLSDREAAERIAQDQLDILFDLKVHTGGARPGILAHRPAPVQAAYLGFPGSAAIDAIDYIVSDRFVTPDSSAPFYSEKFCRLPNSYQCNDDRRAAAPAAGARTMHGLPEDRVVFGVFNQSYKIDRTSFTVWLRVLQEVPLSVLWVLGHNNAAIAHLSREAQRAGLAPERLIFAPFANPSDHLARLQLADAILDTLACNGHTTTSDALWAGVPVVTARGSHFCSRVSESLLNAMGLPELVGADHDAMVAIATRIGLDAGHRDSLRARVRANRSTQPLFDTTRFTRNFETAIELMVQRQRSGMPVTLIDVPDGGPASQRTDIRPPEASTLPLQASYTACPVCARASTTLGYVGCTADRLWHAPLPPSIEWMRCPTCAHVHSRHFWTEAGRQELLRADNGTPAHAANGARHAVDTHAQTVEAAARLLGGYRSLMRHDTPPLWIDVGCGDGSLVLRASDYGFAAVGLELRAPLVAQLQASGHTALRHDFMAVRFEVTPDVLSMVEVLEQLGDPVAALAKAAQILRPGGLLVIRTVDFGSSGWNRMELEHRNPYWSQLERHHLFNRRGLIALLERSGFEIAELTLVSAPEAQMELYATRR